MSDFEVNANGTARRLRSFDAALQRIAAMPGQYPVEYRGNEFCEGFRSGLKAAAALAEEELECDILADDSSRSELLRTLYSLVNNAGASIDAVISAMDKRYRGRA